MTINLPIFKGNYIFVFFQDMTLLEIIIKCLFHAYTEYNQFDYNVFNLFYVFNPILFTQLHFCTMFDWFDS